MTTTPPPSDPDGSLPSYPGDASAGQPAPSYGPPSGGPAPTQPASIANAVKLMWLGGIISILSLVVGLSTFGSQKDEIADAIRESTPNASQDTIDAAIAFSLVFVVIFGAIGAGLWFWMAWKNGQGRSWARVVATVLGALNIIFTLLGFLGGNQQTVVTLLSVVNLVIAVATLVLLWRKESNDFYAAVTRSNQLR